MILEIITKNMPAEETIYEERPTDEVRLIPRKRRQKAPIGPTITIIIAVILLIIAGWFVYDQFSVQIGGSDKTASAGTDQKQAEMDKLIAKVGKLIILPVGENPSIAEITDVEALAKQQPFYEGAKNGDKILLYPNAKMIIIYNELKDILVNVGPLFGTVSEATSTPAENSKPAVEPASSTPAKVIATPATLEIRNGTSKTGWAKTNSNLFVGSPLFTVTKVATASKTNYPVTIVVDQKGIDVSTLENRYGVVATGKMPAGEAPSTADVVIILGWK